MAASFPPKAYVGGSLRPPRPVTIGRRRSDRLLAYATITFMVFLIGFLLYTSWQQSARRDEDRIAMEQREEIIRYLRFQNRDLLCFAHGSQAYHVALGDVILGGRPPAGDADLIARYERLRAAQEELLRVQTLQAPSPPDCFEPYTPVTTR